MSKNHYLLLTLILLLTTKGIAQTKIPGYEDLLNTQYKTRHPEIVIYEQQLETETAAYIKNKNIKGNERTATYVPGNDSFYYDIPVVVHVLHEYGADVVDDKAIYTLIAEMNRFYSMDYDTSAIQPEFKKYVGNPKFRFHLAQKDPFGNPTKGITHQFTYLSAGGDDQAKGDQWLPGSYMNIWLTQYIGPLTTSGLIAAYSEMPPEAEAAPYYDGIICSYQYINDTMNHAGGTIDKMAAKFFNLYYTCGPYIDNTSGECISSDYVDDTPPTDLQLGGCNLYDTVCATNYFVVYPSINIPGTDSIADYPDTAYAQNIMGKAGCSNEAFTLGQIARMQAAANNTIANRNNLWDPLNLFLTGLTTSSSAGAPFLPQNDLPPITDYAVKNSTGNAYEGTYTLFTCPGTKLTFINESYQDTVTSVNWTFNTGGSSIPETTAMATTLVRPTFSEPGWVSLTLSATGNNTGTATTTYPRAVFVADGAGANGDGYYMEFDNSDTAKWPTFNYFNNQFKWQLANVGYYDNSCIEYTGFDSSVNTALGTPYTGTPAGDYDDLFSMPIDLSGFTDTCNLDFYYSAASRTSVVADINDSLEIDYSTDSTQTWHKLTALTKNVLASKGSLSIPYAPLWQGDWSPMTVGIPAAARTNYVLFRFRYYPGVSAPDPYTGTSYSTGNNYYMDRINFNRAPASVSNVKPGNAGITVAPNPTTGDAYVIIKDVQNGTAQIIVSDITGKNIFTTEQQLNGSASALIPHSAIATSGVYMIQITTGSNTWTQKLVVE